MSLRRFVSNFARKSPAPIDRRPNLDFDTILSASNRASIAANCAKRKDVGRIDAVHEKWGQLEPYVDGGFNRSIEAGHSSGSASPSSITEADYTRLWQELYDLCAELPNSTAADVPIGDQPRIVAEFDRTKNDSPPTQKSASSFERLGQRSGALRQDVKHAAGARSYAVQ